MPTTYSGAGADAASQYDAAFRTILDNDPDVQRIRARVWGNTTRDQAPSDTPNNLEDANARASKEIADVLRRKGITLPDRTFVNPRSLALEGHRGYAGLSNWQRAAIIAAAAAATAGAGMALAPGAGVASAAGGTGAAGASGAGAAGLGVTAGLPAAIGGVGATAAGSGLAGLGGLGVTAGLPAAVGGVGATAAGSGLPAAAGGSGILSRILGGNSAGDWADRLGGMVTGMGETAAGNRGQAESAQLIRDQIGRGSVSDYNQAQTDSQRLDLQRRQFGMDSRNDAFKNAMRSGMVSNWAPMSRPANVPSIDFVGKGVGEGGRAAAKEMERQAMLSLMNGEQFDPLPEIERFTPAAAQQPGTLERVSDWLGPLATLFGTRNQGRTPTTPRT